MALWGSYFVILATNRKKWLKNHIETNKESDEKGKYDY